MLGEAVIVDHAFPLLCVEWWFHGGGGWWFGGSVKGVEAAPMDNNVEKT